MTLLSKLQTYTRLGFLNVARVACYRLALKAGLHPVLKIRADVPSGPFFSTGFVRRDLPPPNCSWDKQIWWFGWFCQETCNNAPNWFANPFSNVPQPDATMDWWRLSDFNAGDIKGLWELSRFDWLVACATQAAHGNGAALQRLNNWLEDWAQKNPPYRGPQWKCSQEAAIRVMHLVLSSWILGQEGAPLKSLAALVAAHLQRIEATIAYAVSQQNNHATSEAAALFIGGSFLRGHDERAHAWLNEGRRSLETLGSTLIQPDGTFSQYSVTYHRLMLDTYSLVEVWRRHCGLPALSRKLLERLAAATVWLAAVTEKTKGDTPNIGANDGARLMPLTASDYRDFRPSVELAGAVFCECSFYGKGPWGDLLAWLGVSECKSIKKVASATFDRGGYHVLRNDRALAVLRYPRFRFRPSQADALHLDLWVDGVNLLRDAGTFSYNNSESIWFKSTAAHNTIEFDGQCQMPTLNRFLFGEWLETSSSTSVINSGETFSAAAAYADRYERCHHRSICLDKNSLVCVDTVSGKFKRALLRWRLAPGKWLIEGQSAYCAGLKLSVSSKVGPVSLGLGSAPESRYYHQKQDIPELSVAIDGPTVIRTEISF